MTKIDKNEKKSVALSAALIASGTFSSRVLGLVRDQIVSALFNRTVTDAWLVAFRLPNLFRRILGEGALSVSFIPVFIDQHVGHEGNLSDQPRADAKRLVNAVFTVLFVLLSLMCVSGVIFSEQVVRALASGDEYMSIPGKFELTVRLARIMFIFLMFITFFGYFMSILNALKKFAWAAYAPVFFNVAMIVTALLPQSWVQVPGDYLAWGVVIGGFLQMAVLLPGLYKAGYLPKLSLHLRVDGLGTILKNIVPSMLGAAILQTTTVVNVHFASHLPEGTNTWIYLADRILELPLSLFAVSLGSALLPSLSRAWVAGDRRGMGDISSYYLRLLFFLAVPASVGVYGMSKGIVEVLFMRGKFTPEDVSHTYQILQIYGFAILSFSGVRVLSSSFYAIKNTWLPALISVVCLAVHIFIAPILMEQFQVLGLVGSTVITGTLNVVLLFISYRILIGEMELKKLSVAMAKYLLAAAAMSMVFPLYDYLLSVFTHHFLTRVLALALTIVFSCGIYFSVCIMLRVEEMSTTVNTFKQKFAARFGRKS